MRGIVCIALRTPTLPPADRTNCYVVGHHDALVVDPGSRFEPELDRLRHHMWRLRGRGGRVAGVVLTHHHVDHVGGAATIAREQDAPLLAHPLTLARLGLPGVPLDHGQRLVVGPRREVQVVHTPGHTPGHICLLDPERRTLIAGDMVPGIGTTLVAPPDGDMALYLRSLQRLVELHPDLLLPAHGPPLHDAVPAIQRLVAHRLWREQRILQVLAGSGSDVDLWHITLAAYDDVSPWILPLASRSTLAHLDKLQQEGRVRRGSNGCWLTA